MNTEEKEQALIEEGKLINKTKPVKKQTVVAFTPDFKTRLQDYLETRPYTEVEYFMSVLKSSNPFEVAFND